MIAAMGPGATFAGYRVESLVGRGGMGVVCRIEDGRLRFQTAVVPPAELLARRQLSRAGLPAFTGDHPAL
jgi:hypothetical protein